MLKLSGIVTSNIEAKIKGCKTVNKFAKSETKIITKKTFQIFLKSDFIILNNN